MRKIDKDGLLLCDMQGKAFELSVTAQDNSSEIFIRRFMNSEVAKQLDNMSVLQSNIQAADILSLIDEEYGKSNYGSVKYTPNELYWIGYLYRYFSYTYDKTSVQVYKIVKPKELRGLFLPYHTMDPSQAIDRILEAKGLANDSVDEEYNEVKQNYLLERNYIKSANALINRADAINGTASATKKASDLESFQSDLKSFGKSASLQNFFIVLTYILGIGALALMVFFLLTNMIANFKTSYKILLGLLLLVVAFFIGYLIGTPTLSPSAIKAGMTGSGYKMVNAAVFTVYVCLFGAILAIIVSLIMNAVKNRN